MRVQRQLFKREVLGGDFNLREALQEIKMATRRVSHLLCLKIDCVIVQQCRCHPNLNKYPFFSQLRLKSSAIPRIYFWKVWNEDVKLHATHVGSLA